MSGCACAAWLAGWGIAVTVVSSALDSVGLPGYGPIVVAGTDRAAVADAVAAIPAPLRDVWVGTAVTPDCEAGFFAVDRRTVSIETKRALELLPGLELRQGLVTDLRIGSDDGGQSGEAGVRPGQIALGTAFGEVIEGDAVVIAVGLSLGGHVHVGEDVLPGGRYGETQADGLRAALEDLGACFEETMLQVGPCVGGRGTVERLAEVGRLGLPRSLSSAVGEDPRRSENGGERTSVVKAVPLPELIGHGGPARGTSSREWPEDYPPPPQCMEGLRIDAMVVTDAGRGEPAPLLSPDGIATGEVHVSLPGESGRARRGSGDSRRWDVIEGEEPAMASRLSQSVKGSRITNLTPRGRLVASAGAAPLMWVAGRAGGADGYVESLCSGARVAEDIAAVLGAPRTGAPQTSAPQARAPQARAPRTRAPQSSVPQEGGR